MTKHDFIFLSIEFVIAVFSLNAAILIGGVTISGIYMFATGMGTAFGLAILSDVYAKTRRRS